MKVYSKKQVERMVLQAINDLQKSMVATCIDSVKNRIDEMVGRRDLADLTRMEQRITSLEIDGCKDLRQPPKPKHTEQRRKVVDSLNGRV